MGKKSSAQTVDQSPWGPTQGSLKYALSELDRLYGRPAQHSQTRIPNFASGQIDNSVVGGNAALLPMLGLEPAMPAVLSSPMSGSPSPSQVASPVASPVQEYGLIDPAAAELMATIKGERMFQNPNLDEVIRRASADVNSQFEGMGRYGSGAHLDQLFSRAAAPIRYQDYATERANQLNAVQAAPGFEMAPFQLYSARTAAPYEGIKNYLDLLNPIARGGSQQSSPIYRNPLAGALGGGLAGYTLGGAAGSAYAGSAIDAAMGAGSSFGPWGALLGGALGYLGS